MSVINVPAKSDVVSSIRALQAQNGVRVYAESTLARMKAADLTDLEESLLAQVRAAAEEAAADAAAEANKAPESSGRRGGGRRLFSDDAVIRVIGTVSGREGSAAMARRSLLGDGLTVAEFLARVFVETGSFVGGRRTIRKAIRKGLVRLEGGASSTDASDHSVLYLDDLSSPVEAWAIPGTPFMEIDYLQDQAA